MTSRARWSRIFVLALSAAALAPAVRGAEGGPQAAGDGEAGAVRRAFVAGLRGFHDFNRTNVIAAAEAVPEESYVFRATPEVRSFGQLVGHVADTLYFACAGMRGEPNPNEKDHRPGVVAEDSIERNRTTRAELVAAVKAAFAYCDEAFALAEAAPVVAGEEGQGAFHASLAVYHTGLHYGNMVTSMRLLGIVPPSSAGP
jgi:hypothetical protein